MSLQGSNPVPVQSPSVPPNVPPVSPPSAFHLGTPSQFPPASTLAPFTSLPPFPPSSSPAAPSFVSHVTPPPPSAPRMSSPPAGPPMSTFSVGAGHDITKGHAGRTPQTPLIPTFSSPGPVPGETQPSSAAGFMQMWLQVCVSVGKVHFWGKIKLINVQSWCFQPKCWSQSPRIGCTSLRP